MKFTSLDSLRGLAALAVAAYHSNFLAGEPGNVLQNAPLFVDFFFVLSGFVIAYAYRDRIVAGASAFDFVLLRLGRIYPLHACMLAAWLVWLAADCAFGAGPCWRPGFDADGLVLNLTLLNSIGLDHQESWNYPAWSVGAEMLAYLVFFWIVSVMGRRLTPAASLAIGLCAYLVVVAVSDVTLQRTYDLGLLRCLGGFFVGVAMYGAFEAATGEQAGSAGEIGAVVMVATFLMMPAGSVWVELATVAAFAWMVLVFANSSGAISALLRRGLFRFLGRISYSIYMTHALIFLIAFEVAERVWDLPRETIFSAAEIGRIYAMTPYAPLITGGLLASVVAVSALTYRFIEEPCRRAVRAYVRDRGAARDLASVPVQRRR